MCINAKNSLICGKTPDAKICNFCFSKLRIESHLKLESNDLITEEEEKVQNALRNVKI
jgi:hypothetical protein